MLVSEQTLTYPRLLNTMHLWLFFISLFLVHQYPDPPFIPFLCTCTPCLASCLALLIPHHVWLCLFAPAPYNKTMMDLITLPDSQSLYFFFSHSISHFLHAYLSFFPLSLSLFSSLSCWWWAGEYAHRHSICPTDKDVSGDGCSARRRAAGPCQCWSVFGDG